MKMKRFISRMLVMTTHIYWLIFTLLKFWKVKKDYEIEYESTWRSWLFSFFLNLDANVGRTKINFNLRRNSCQYRHVIACLVGSQKSYFSEKKHTSKTLRVCFCLFTTCAGFCLLRMKLQNHRNEQQREFYDTHGMSFPHAYAWVVWKE